MRMKKCQPNESLFRLQINGGKPCYSYTWPCPVEMNWHVEDNWSTVMYPLYNTSNQTYLTTFGEEFCIIPSRCFSFIISSADPLNAGYIQYQDNIIVKSNHGNQKFHDKYDSCPIPSPPPSPTLSPTNPRYNEFKIGPLEHIIILFVNIALTCVCIFLQCKYTRSSRQDSFNESNRIHNQQLQNRPTEKK